MQSVLTETEKGLTLIEVMIALVIFLIGSLGVIHVVMSGNADVRQGQNLTTAYQLSQTTTAFLRSSGNAAISFNGFSTNSGSTSGNTLVAADESAITALVAGLPSGTETVTVASLLGNGSCPCSVALSTGWTDPGGQVVHFLSQTTVGY